MELTVSYTIKAAFVLLVLYLFYYGLLRSQTNFSFNRLYLLLAPLVALALPLVKWPIALAPENAVSEILQSIQLTEVTVTAYRPDVATAVEPSFTATSIAWRIYAFGALFVLLKLAKQLWQIQQFKTKAATYQVSAGAVKVYQLPNQYPTFAFGKAVFLSKQDHLNSADQEKILAHETAHVQLHHTWDVLYFELLTALLWLNPIIWLLKQELRDVHEYQADARVVHTYRTQEYSALLSRKVLQQMGLPIGSYFQKPQVLKRLHMLQQTRQQSGWLRPLLILPMLGCLLLGFSLQQVDAQAALSTELTPEEKVTLTDSQQQADQKRTLQTQQQETPLSIIEKNPAVAQPVAKEPESKPALLTIAKEASTTKEKPYTYVEQMPQFEGGETELLKYLAKNIRYPNQAQLEGIEGLVVVSFTVEDNGALNDIQVLKSVEESIDAEAVRVVENMNMRWSPGTQNGKPVGVKYTLPVRFALK